MRGYKIQIKPTWVTKYQDEKEKEFMQIQDVKEMYARANALVKEAEALSAMIEERKKTYFEEVVKPGLEKLKNERAEEESSSDEEDEDMKGLRALFHAAIRMGDNDCICDNPHCVRRKRNQ